MSARQPLQSLEVIDTARVQHIICTIECYFLRQVEGRGWVPNYAHGCGEHKYVRDFMVYLSSSHITWMAIQLMRSVGST